MNTEVRMPQMGESIVEGTIVKWFKNVGDSVKRDEPLFEITTDKVDTEVPAPGDGYVTSILVAEGETVAVNTTVCLLGDERADPADQASGAKASTASQATRAPEPVSAGAERAAAVLDSPSRKARLRARSSPLVRRMAAEHGIDLSQVQGTGVEGRVTKQDVSKFLREQPTGAVSLPEATGRLEPMSLMRRRIAEHMVMSRKTSAHVTTVFEVDMTSVRQRKEALGPALLEKGARLTYLPFIALAVRDALGDFPILNASVEGDKIRYHDDINIGIAVALDDGLIVPVLKDIAAASLETDLETGLVTDLVKMARGIQDLAQRAREKELKPEEVQGGTFTITNPGLFGALIGTPIINQPQVAILCVGKVEKRPVVVADQSGKDTVVARTMCYLSLSYDHRVVDGKTADDFLARIKNSLETDSSD